MEREPLQAGLRAASFVPVMRAAASGVVIVSTYIADRPWGVTATAFSSLTASPPRCLICLQGDTTIARGILLTNRFGVDLLTEDQQDIAAYCAAPGSTKFLESVCAEHVTDGDHLADAERLGNMDAPNYAGVLPLQPYIAGSLGHFDCSIETYSRHGDHLLIVGAVTRSYLCARIPSPAPLIYSAQRYRQLRTLDDRSG